MRPSAYAKKEPRTRRGSRRPELRGRLELVALRLEICAHLGDELGAEIVGEDLHHLGDVLVDREGRARELLARRCRIEVDHLLQLIRGKCRGVDPRKLVVEVVTLALVGLEDLT